MSELADSPVYAHEDYALAACVLWGDGGAYLLAEYARHNARYFGGRLPPLPVVIGITPYGKCNGMTRPIGRWGYGEVPRITIASKLFASGTVAVSDVLLHEMIHAKLILEGADPSHNGRPWCEEIERLSPLVLGEACKAAPVRPQRINGAVKRMPLPGHLSRAELAQWPGSRTGGTVIAVPSS